MTARMKAEVFETQLYGCVAWNPRPEDCDKLRKAHLEMPLRYLGWGKRKDQILSYAHSIVKTDPGSIEATVR